LSHQKGLFVPIEFIPDLERVEYLSMIQCTDSEMAADFGVDRRTIARHKKKNPDFAAAIKNGKEKGKTSIRSMQWTLAHEGNVVMLKMLCQQQLDQRDYKPIAMAALKVKADATPLETAQAAAKAMNSGKLDVDSAAKTVDMAEKIVSIENQTALQDRIKELEARLNRRDKD
jgi:hypothetical protein